jgi:serine/threonine protein kinase
VVLFEMIFGMCPFQSNSIANLIEVLNSKELNFPGPVSPFLKNLITRMLTKDPIRRISWMEIFQIRINAQGEIENDKITPKINSLSDAKNSEEGGLPQQLLHSNKLISKDTPEEPTRDFKKNRGLSTNSNGNSGTNSQPINSPPPAITTTPSPPPPISINIGPNGAYVPTINSPTLPPNVKPVYV